MLSQFVHDHRSEIVARCRAQEARRTNTRPPETELALGIPAFLDQLQRSLEPGAHDELTNGASQHGNDLLRRGFTVGQVVHGYGDACQTITELAIECDALITIAEFRTLNRCLDDAIADAVTEFARQHELDAHGENVRRNNEDVGFLVHEVRNLLSSAVLAFDVLRGGSVGIRGSTGDVLGRSLLGLRDLVDRSLAEVRLTAGITKPAHIGVAHFVEEIEISAVLGARARHVKLSVGPVEPDLALVTDRQILGSILSNLLQNGFENTRQGGHVQLHVRATPDRVLFDIEDQCGGLPPSTVEHLFEPFEHRSRDRTGIGLGLAICARGVEALHGTIHVDNHPGLGCVFTVDLPRAAAN